MPKHMLTLGAVLIATTMAWVGLVAPPAMAQRARVPQTGQTECWKADGSPSMCDGTGQDGDIQAGVASPTPRFTDRRDGTVRDNLTGLLWLKDAHCFQGGGGGLLWQDALDAANTLASGSCGLSDGSRLGDWRLANVKELQSLLDFGRGVPPALPAGYPFSNVPTGGNVFYWSSTTMQDEFDSVLTYAYIVRIDFGFTQLDLKASTFHRVWPVKGGD
jgi:hypothetical protein